MKKFAFGFACVLAGSVVGAIVPRVVAQTATPTASAQRWQHSCVEVDANRISSQVSAAQSIATSKGAEGWELAATISSDGNGGHPILCFKRPVPTIAAPATRTAPSVPMEQSAPF